MTQAILTAAQWLNFDGLADLIRDYRRKSAQKALERQTIKELSRLSDRELHDLGIGRSDIRSIARGDFYRDQVGTNKNLGGWV
jgi:uncharacterized protein YjiS (DUF1127 family)